MHHHLRWQLVVCCLLLITPALRADGDDAQALTAKIDTHIKAQWEKAGIIPAPQSSDSEFLRRVYLDLMGRIPSVHEVREFLRDKAPDKRRRVINDLLQQPRYIVHFTNYWRDLLLPEASATANFQVRGQVPGFESWLRGQLSENAHYDDMVREILTVSLPGTGRNPGLGIGRQGGANPLAFYLAKENKAEELAGSMARLFLGASVECAQCHDHPFADWSRDDFWSFAAFFSGIRSTRRGNFTALQGEDIEKRDIQIPNTKRTVQANFLNGIKPKWKDKVSARVTLAEWMTARDNPYFARAAANRMWAYFFGRGLIDPVDEMVGAGNDPSHPELLDLLAKDFADHDFDLKYLIRAIANSETYQLSSAQTHKSQDAPELFARMPLRGLTGEQLYDSVAQATGYRDNQSGSSARFRFNDRSARGAFLGKFGNQPGSATDVQTSILQALTMMNGQLVSTATDLKNSRTLAAVVDVPFMNNAERIETLYLATLSRRPTAREADRLAQFLARNDNRDTALADVFWVLLNSSEFFLNH